MKPTEGQQAPDFEFETLDGQRKKLSDMRGKKIILYFYPKDNTPGCTAEACSLRDAYADFSNANTEVVGVSADDEEKHAKFRKKHDLPFPLIADTDKKVIAEYGVWGRKKFMGKEFDGIIRTTFIIDEKGKIAHVIDKVKTKTHAEQINEILND